MLLVSILLGLALATAQFFLLNWAYMWLGRSRFWFREPTSGRVSMPALWQAIGTSLVTGTVFCVAPRLTGWGTWFSILLFALMVTEMVNLFIWWARGGSRFREMAPFALLAVVVCPVMGSAAAAMATLIPVAFVVALLHVLPWLVMVAFFGLLLGGVLFYKYRHPRAGTPRLRRYLVTGIISAVLFGLIFLWTLISALAPSFGGINWDELFGRRETVSAMDGSQLDIQQPVDPAPTTPTATTNPKDNWHFRHDDVIADNYDSNGNLLEGEELETARMNDYDFGHSVLDEALAAGLTSGQFSMEDLAGKTERELFEMVGANSIVRLMVDAMNEDPALGAAVMCYHDAVFGTREFIGDFFSQYEDEPDRFMKAMNAMKDYWVTDKAAYYQAVQHWINIVYTAKSIKVEHQGSGIDDQMYQHGPVTLEETKTMIPDVIVMTSYDHSGYFITFTYVVKETRTVNVSYRIDCGFQPCNVSKIMETTPAPNPNGSKPVTTTSTPTQKPSNNTTPVKDPTPTPTKPDPTPKPSGNGAGGNPNPDPTPTPKPSGDGAGGNPNPDPTPSTPTPTPEITNPKDPSKGTEVPVNDNPGPGPDTNNGVGAQYSAVQEPTGSTFLPTYEDYEEAMRPIEENPARPAGTPNTPTYNPVDEGKPAPDSVDNNGDNGYGWGGADDPTPVQPPAEVETPGYDPGSEKVEWGGPPL